MNHYGEFFENMYDKSSHELHQIPWAKLQPNKHLVSFLESAKHTFAQKEALVVGCGLGDDSEYLSTNGFSTTAFDFSIKALDHTKSRYTNSVVDYCQQDILNLPQTYNDKFDLVFEAYTLQSLPNAVRKQALINLAKTVKKDGLLFIICFANLQNLENPDGPPHPVKSSEVEIVLDFGFVIEHFELSSNHNRPEYFYIFRKV